MAGHSHLPESNFDFTESNLPLNTLRWGLVGLLGLLIGSMAFLFMVYGSQVKVIDPKNVLSRTMNTQPLMVNYRKEYSRHKAAQLEKISKYAWADSSKSRAKVPIERAMELVLEQGLPSRETKK